MEIGETTLCELNPHCKLVKLICVCVRVESPLQTGVTSMSVNTLQQSCVCVWNPHWKLETLARVCVCVMNPHCKLVKLLRLCLVQPALCVCVCVWCVRLCFLDGSSDSWSRKHGLHFA